MGGEALPLLLRVRMRSRERRPPACDLRLPRRHRLDAGRTRRRDMARRRPRARGRLRSCGHRQGGRPAPRSPAIAHDDPLARNSTCRRGPSLKVGPEPVRDGEEGGVCNAARRRALHRDRGRPRPAEGVGHGHGRLHVFAVRGRNGEQTRCVNTPGNARPSHRIHAGAALVRAAGLDARPECRNHARLSHKSAERRTFRSATPTVTF